MPPYTWEQLYPVFLRCLREKTDFPLHLTRTPAIQEAYHRRCASKTHQVILSKLFNSISINTVQESAYVIRPNEFPYDLHPFLNHWVIWINPKQTTYSLGPILDPKLIQIAQQRFPRHDLMYFRNQIANQTVPKIPHYHLITRELT